MTRKILALLIALPLLAACAQVDPETVEDVTEAEAMTEDLPI
ncbi:hypothetical protein PVW48_07375 [Dinoroseobacter sp. PD6]|nr:hypothetical protein [Dinoroseobacter sp. PD6]MDD9716556.1 hypothetical protein [Dinoroseobacter sp. PD6]